MEKDKDAYKELDEISNIFGLKEDKRTIFEVGLTSDPNERSLSLKNGSWSGKEPWFAIDENENIYTIVSIKSFWEIVSSYRSIQRQIFNLRLEKSIWQNIPIDFSDVWAVAMQEIEKIDNQKSEINSIDVDNLIKGIKRDYPNLFVNIKQIM